MGTLRSELYGTLAEVFADPPDWLAISGSEWPLYAIAADLAGSSTAARQAVESMKGISPEPIAMRQERYAALFAGPGRPRFWLYESLYRSGKMFGAETMEVEGIYRAAGLAIEGAELPDHASLELAFLAYAANQQAAPDPQRGVWVEIERNFIKAHAGQWLPGLGRDLAASGDGVYAPIGQLLAGWLTRSRRPLPRGNAARTGVYAPVMPEAGNCSLCGFCAQVCPRQALSIHEDSSQTALVRSGKPCSGCGRMRKDLPNAGLAVRKIKCWRGESW